MYYIVCGWLGVTLVANLIGWTENSFMTAGDLRGVFPAWFARWDSGFYIQIATDGYAVVDPEIEGDKRAFFPLYPFTVGWVSRLTGFSPYWVGFLLSLVAFALSTTILLKYVQLDYGPEHAKLAVLMLCLSPVAYYFVSIYAESFLLMFSLLSAWFARKQQFIVSGICICLAGFTRPYAFLLAFPFAAQFLQSKGYRSRSTTAQFLIGAAIAPLGYLGYIWALSGYSSIAAGFAEYEKLLYAFWNTYHDFPWNILYDSFQALVFGVNIKPDWFSRAYSIHDVIHAFALLGLTLWSLTHLKLWSEKAWLIAGTIYLFSVHGPYGYVFDSAPRHVALIAPIYSASASFVQHLPRWTQITVIISALVALGLLTAWFTSGRWVS
ncbi:MAG: hypothetical protein HC853_08815 [Anaerolineae bacterium]|nr:hypothetical protein [Anaerolineae bacterium]